MSNLTETNMIRMTLKAGMIALGLAFTATVSTAAISEKVAIVQVSEPTKTEIAYGDLPEAVTKSFEASDYKDWKVAKVYKVEEEGKVTYELMVTGQEKEVALAYDETGKLIEE